MKLMIQNVRMAFPNIFTPRAFGDGEPDFNGLFLLAPNHKQIKEINAAIDAVGKEKWGAKADAILKTLRATDKTFLHNGDTKSQYEGFEGNLFIAARSKIRPTTLNRDRSPLTAEDGVLYSGCYVNLSIEGWAQDNKFGKRVNATLRGVQYFGPGDAFGGATKPADADEFSDVSVEDTETMDI